MLRRKDSVKFHEMHYHCGQIYEVLTNGPTSESSLLNELKKQNVNIQDATNCLVIMEKNGSIQRNSKTSNDPLWQLSTEFQSGDFSEDADPVSPTENITDAFANVCIQSQNQGNEGRSSLSTASLPPPTVKRNIRPTASNETSVKSTNSMSSEHSFSPIDSTTKSSTKGSSSSAANLGTVLYERRSNNVSTEDTSFSSTENNLFSEETFVKSPAFNHSFNNSLETESNETSNMSSASVPQGEGQIMMQTVQQTIDGRTQTQRRYMSQSQRNPAQQTISVGQISVETTAPVNKFQHTELDPKLEPSYIMIKKILQCFDDPSNADLKPHEVAKKSGVGQSKKDVNKVLYLLKKKGVLTLKTEDGGKNPRWSRNHDFKYSEKQLQEWAAEITYNTSNSALSPTPVVNHHHHEHKHTHTNVVQAGDNNRVVLTTRDQETQREEETERLTEGVVSSVQQSQNQ